MLTSRQTSELTVAGVVLIGLLRVVVIGHVGVTVLVPVTVGPGWNVVTCTFSISESAF